MNLLAILAVGVLTWLHRRHVSTTETEGGMEMAGGGALKRSAAWSTLALLLLGTVSWVVGGS